MSAFIDQVLDRSGGTGYGETDFDGRSDTISGEHLSLIPENATQSGRKALLSRIIEAQVIPRLAQAHRTAAPGKAEPVTTEDDTAELVRLLLTQEASAALVMVEALQARGATASALFLGILTQAARQLGALWEDDRCDFTQVTVGMGRLQQVLRALSPSFQVEAIRRVKTESVLLVPAPGEQHTLGLMMLGEFFRREGWHVAGGPATSAKDAADIVHGTWMDVAGFSIASFGRMEGLAQCIRSVRRASTNRDIYIMVGGPLFLSHPELLARVGADTAATDAESAVRQARGLLADRTAAD